jgi:hypothetical protein
MITPVKDSIHRRLYKIILGGRTIYKNNLLVTTCEFNVDISTLNQQQHQSLVKPVNFKLGGEGLSNGNSTCRIT